MRLRLVPKIVDVDFDDCWLCVIMLLLIIIIVLVQLKVVVQVCLLNMVVLLMKMLHLNYKHLFKHKLLSLSLIICALFQFSRSLVSLVRAGS